MKHPSGCGCVVCKPVRCLDCGSTNPDLVDGICRHRRACKGRQMLAEDYPAALAAAHAQGRSFDTEEETDD